MDDHALRPLGDTGLRVSALGLGLAALGRPGYINLGHGADLEGEREPEAMRARAHAVLDAAWKGGVRYLDAARSYGRAEEFLASWLAARGRKVAEAVVVGSKWGYTYTAKWRVAAEVHEVKEHSAEVLRRQWRESRGLLDGHLALYQIHSATLESGVLRNREVLAELARLRAEGVRIGLSLSGPAQADTLRRAREVEVGGARLFDAVQATWNLLEPSAGAELAAARAEGMGVIVKEALANGRLTDRNRDPDFESGRELLLREARRLDTTPDALALAAALAQPWADVVLSGATTTQQLRSNLQALRVQWDPAAARVLAGLAEEPTAYWERRGRMPWN